MICIPSADGAYSFPDHNIHIGIDIAQHVSDRVGLTLQPLVTNDGRLLGPL
jgi:hypothetical protein